MEIFEVIVPALLKGAEVSLKLFTATLVLSLPLGLPIGLGENSRFAPLRWFCKFYVFIFRGTPLMLQLFFFYYFFPIALNIKMQPMPTAILTFALNYAAYFAEIYRGGLNSIEKGQYEAAHSLGLSRRQTLTDIVLPQMFRVVLPPISNEVIVLIKDTALASVIAIADIMRVSKSIVNRDGSLMAYVVAGAIYLLFTLLITFVLNKCEKRFSRYDISEA